jgi:hypothetical protein
MRRRGLHAPLWFHLAFAALVGTMAHLCGFHELEASPVTLAFFGWLITLAELVFAGLHAAADVVIAYLAWAVNALFFLGQLAYNALVELGGVAMRGIRQAWRFFRWTYDDILAPAWRKFWRLVDVVRGTLERVLRPVFAVLRRIRDELLHLYAKWVRPVLDTIETTRKVLRVLSALHIPFARKLDHQLAELEEKIDRPFRYLLGKVNEVINFVNRIATADGLFQRLALVRSIARDWQVIGDEYARMHRAPMTDEERRRRSLQEVLPLPAWEPGQELGKFYSGEGGAYDGIIKELAAEWRVAAGLHAS